MGGAVSSSQRSSNKYLQIVPIKEISFGQPHVKEVPREENKFSCDQPYPQYFFGLNSGVITTTKKMKKMKKTEKVQKVVLK